MSTPLHSVPTTPPKGRRPVDVYPKPNYKGVQPKDKEEAAEVSRALRRVVQDHTYTKPRETARHHQEAPSKIAMFLWMLVIGGIVLAGAIINKPRDEKPVKTYLLQPSK